MISNNNGWGLREMLFLSAIILIAVLVVAILINNLYSGLTSGTTTTTTSSYSTIESNLLSAAKKYYKANADSIGEIIISDLLIDEGYLTVSKLTMDDDICSGYVLISSSGSLTPYITCANYETEGY